VIIPADNLTGPGGIDRLPKPLRNELLVLTIDEWRRGTRRFEHERHTVQVVAVRHITEAFDVAVLPADSAAGLIGALEKHARRFGLLENRTCPTTVLVKNAEELAEAGAPDSLCARCPGCEVLVRGPVADQVLDVLGQDRTGARLIEIGDNPDDFGRALGAAAARLSESSEPLVVVAPLFALKGLDLESIAGGHPLLAFANNTIVGHGKLKSVKPAVHRLVCRLLHLGPEALDAFPMLRRVDGIYLPDLELVAEAVRLDSGRSAEILSAAVDHWIELVDAGLDEPG